MTETLTPEDVKDIIPDVVQKAYLEEEQFIAQRVEFARRAGESLIQKAFTWVPYVDAVFEENEIGVESATSDINRDTRVKIVIDKIEKGLGFSLDAETKANIRKDVWQMYTPGTDSDE